MKKFLMYFAAAVAAMAFAGCHPEDQPGRRDKEEKGFDHMELSLSTEYSQDIIDNFDISYTVKSAGKEIGTGKLDKLKNEITVNKGINVNADVNIIIDANAKSEFPVINQEYDLNNHVIVTFNGFNKDGSSYSAGGLDMDNTGGNFKVENEADREEAREVLTDLIKTKLNIGFILSGSQYRIDS